MSSYERGRIDGEVLIEFILLVELTIIQQMKLELGCGSVGAAFCSETQMQILG